MNNIDVVARFEKDNNEYMYLYDVSNDSVYCLCTSNMANSFTSETVYDIAYDLMDAKEIYYINKDYIKSIQKEIFETVEDAELFKDAYSVLYHCYLWEDRK